MAMRDDEFISWFRDGLISQRSSSFWWRVASSFRASEASHYFAAAAHPSGLPRSIVSEHGRQSTQWWFGDGPSTAGRLGRGRADGPRD